MSRLTNLMMLFVIIAWDASTHYAGTGGNCSEMSDELTQSDMTRVVYDITVTRDGVTIFSGSTTKPFVRVEEAQYNDSLDVTVCSRFEHSAAQCCESAVLKIVGTNVLAKFRKASSLVGRGSGGGFSVGTVSVGSTNSIGCGKCD